MPLSVTLLRVKERCGIADSSYDTPITNLISDIVPALNFAIDPVAMASEDSNLAAYLNLGALELVCGEFLAQLSREPGALDSISFGGLNVSGPKVDPADPSGLKAQGSARLRPFLRQDLSPANASGVRSGVGR